MSMTQFQPNAPVFIPTNQMDCGAEFNPFEPIQAAPLPKLGHQNSYSHSYMNCSPQTFMPSQHEHTMPYKQQ